MGKDLMGWLELVDASSILRASEVDQKLKELIRDDENASGDEIVWNQDFTVPLHMSILYWDGIPPQWEELLDMAVSELQPGEFLIFEEKIRASLGREWSSRTLLVSPDGVKYLTSAVLREQLLKETDLTPKAPVEDLDVEVAPREVQDDLDL